MSNWHILSPPQFADYQLIDSGHFEKMERFGPYVLIRPEPQAVWKPTLSPDQWRQQAQVRFVQEGSHKGYWERYQHNMPDNWHLAYPPLKLRFKLALTAFKHVGIFPEQSANWQYAHTHCQRIPQAQILNLFAYTGGATLACRAAGAQVTHVDAIRQVVTWANENLVLSGMDGVRWLVEDALKYVQRAARKGQQFQGIIMDPPAFGHGPKGERWKLEDLVDELMAQVAAILDPKAGFLIFNAYSMGFSPLILENLMRSHLPAKALRNLEMGELVLPEAHSARRLPAGIFARISY
ncbi:MAG: class I SAM-dependent methyltransferase [Bacteroidetes bacterium]|nr:class I SAM-dependent methyltransferase [Bacteroidota bacterium]